MYLYKQINSVFKCESRQWCIIWMIFSKYWKQIMFICKNKMLINVMSTTQTLSDVKIQFHTKSDFKH